METLDECSKTRIGVGEIDPRPPSMAIWRQKVYTDHLLTPTYMTTLFAIVTKHWCSGDLDINAGDGTQILVNRTNVVIRHVLVNRPRHHLKHCSIERRQEAGAIGRSGAVWMNFVVIFSSSQNRKELLKGVSSFGPSGLVRGQVA